MSDSIILYKDRRAYSCFIDEIYDPDLDGDFNENSAKVIPYEGAKVTDRDTGYGYHVTYVDPLTYKTTLRADKILVTDDEDATARIISYGNDKYMLYYDDRTKPTKIQIDGKLVVFGSHLSEYRLIRNATSEYISLYVENNETYSGDRIPLANVSDNISTKILTNCHTLFTLTDGETVTAEIYDNLGILTISVQLFVKRATILNDLLSDSLVITGFDASATQMTDDNNFYIYQRQDYTKLGITPMITYSNGSTEQVTIDSNTCFLYGLEGFVPSFPGQIQKLLIKKFLSTKQSSDLSETDGITRYISVVKYLTVLQNDSIDNIKVSVIPLYSTDKAMYELKLLAYSDKRTTLEDVTNNVTYTVPFDGTNYSTLQYITFTVDLQELLGLEAPVIHAQEVGIKLSRPTEFQKYVITDDESTGIYYGVESSTIRRPVLHYDTTLRQYFVPTSRFANQAAFLEAFYYKASPPTGLSGDTVVTVPTHFTIRDVDKLTAIVATPIEVSEYNKAMNLITNIATSDGTYLDKTVVFEFLTNVGDEYQIIYGVPVEVYTSSTGYNTETN